MSPGGLSGIMPPSDPPPGAQFVPVASHGDGAGQQFGSVLAQPQLAGSMHGSLHVVGSDGSAHGGGGGGQVGSVASVHVPGGHVPSAEHGDGGGGHAGSVGSVHFGGGGAQFGSVVGSQPGGGGGGVQLGSFGSHLGGCGPPSGPQFAPVVGSQPGVDPLPPPLGSPVPMPPQSCGGPG